MDNRKSSGFSIGNTLGDAHRKSIVYLSVLSPPTLLYLLVVVPYAWNNQPVSRFFGLPKNDATAVLIDLCIAALPILAVIAGYLMLLGRQRRAARGVFLAEFEAADLVRARHNPNIVYAVLERGPDGGVERMQAVWSMEGRCRDGAVYENVDAAGVSPFDKEIFLDG